MKKIVTIGGGTGSFVLLSGLKKYPVKLSAIVNMIDSGGSTGILRDELGVLPPGDVRQCLVALSDSSNEIRKLMNYRFDRGIFKGHSFGNLFLGVLEKINKNFIDAVDKASKILNIKGEIIPAIISNSHLYIKLKNGYILKGEHEISSNQNILKFGIDKIYLKPKPKINPKAIKRILDADMVVIGPGSLYSSILPNLIIPEIKNAILKSKALVVFNCNLVNKKGQTNNFTLRNYVDLIHFYLGKERINFVTFNNKKPQDFLIKKYIKKGEDLICLGEIDNNRKYKIILSNLLNLKNKIYLDKNDLLIKQRSLIRHDSQKLAKILMFILELKENSSIFKNII
ncbi:MAG: YvcK family protein [bacterium]|nr:YvcK family protein [Patescibacteria group bacterium]MDW8280007.1 YvcK family protein [bacterium]